MNPDIILGVSFLVTFNRENDEMENDSTNIPSSNLQSFGDGFDKSPVCAL